MRLINSGQAFGGEQNTVTQIPGSPPSRREGSLSSVVYLHLSLSLSLSYVYSLSLFLFSGRKGSRLTLRACGNNTRKGNQPPGYFYDYLYTVQVYCIDCNIQEEGRRRRLITLTSWDFSTPPDFFFPLFFFFQKVFFIFFFIFFFSLPFISSITNPSRFNVSFLLSMHDLVSSAHFAKMLDLSSRTESRYVSVPRIMCEKDKSKDTAATMRKSTVILETLRA